MPSFANLLGAFHSAETDAERGNALFAIFQDLYDSWDGDEYPCSFQEIAVNLYRLNVVDGWEAGAFFFKLFTGSTIEEEEATTFVDPTDFSENEIDEEDIHSRVDYIGGPLASLYYDDEEESDDEEEDTYEDDSFIENDDESSEEEESEEEEEDNEFDDYSPEEIAAAATVMGLTARPVEE